MVLIDNRQQNVLVQEDFKSKIEELVDFSLPLEGLKEEYELSIIFVDNEGIKEINREFRSIDKPTDVLSFPMLEYPEHITFKDIYLNKTFDCTYYDQGKLILGDIAISLEKALEQSEEFGHSFYREVTYLLIHSILHLLGYDHIEEQDKEKMRIREEEILREFNLKRNRG